MSKSTAKARAAHWKKMAKYSDRDPRAYEPAPGDKTAKTKLSKYTKKYREMFGEEMQTINEKAAAGLAAKAKKSGISLSTLKTVYRRGVAAWNSGHRPGTTPQQWGHARVNSYITKGKTYHTADKDLREEGGAGEEGTKKLLKKYLKDTPYSKIQKIKESLILEAVSNDDKGKLFELLHAKHMHPQTKLPSHYRDEQSGKTPEQVHDSIKSRITKADYETIDRHAKDSSSAMKKHLREQGHNPQHITHVAWTSNGASDVKKFTGKEDPHNDSDVMYKFKHPKTGKVSHAGAGLKYGSQKEPNIRNPGLDSLERMTGSKTIVSRFNNHKKNISKLGYTGTAAENHVTWKGEKDSTRGKAANESKLEATRGIAGDIHKALSKKSSNELAGYIKNVVSPKTEHSTYRLHTRTSHNEAGSSATHHIDEPSKDIEKHLSKFSSFHVDEKHNGGISTTIHGTRKSDGKKVAVLTHAVKGVSGPMKGLAASTKLPGYHPKSVSGLNEAAVLRKKYLGNLKGKTETGKRANQINMEPKVDIGTKDARSSLRPKSS